MSPNVIAVVDDDDATLQMLDALLNDAGYQVISSTSSRDAHQFILRSLPDLVLLDLWIGEQRAGIQILDALSRDASTRDIPVIVCSGQVDYLRMQAPLFRALGYQILEKPFQPPRLLAQIEAALQRWPPTN
ncbi:MAG TPA: response regulator [Herpetosiphonaceae bacterium]